VSADSRRTTITLTTALGDTDPRQVRVRESSCDGVPSRMIRVTALLEQLRSDGETSSYSLELSGPIVTRTGRDHATWTGLAVYDEDLVGPAGHTIGDLLRPFVAGRAALEELLDATRGTAR
jgi:hypothetical protein